MTETTSVALLPDMKDLVSGTCGKLLSTVEARLVSTDTGLDVAEGESGELWLRGPVSFSLFPLYLGNSDYELLILLHFFFFLEHDVSLP